MVAQTVPNPEDVYASSYDDESAVVHVGVYGPLTTHDEIRSVFGLSDVELPDEMLGQRIYSKEVLNALNALDPYMEDEWVRRSNERPNLKPLVETFALYCIADKLCDVLPLIAARSLSDSKATFQRFDSDLQAVISTIRGRYERATDALKAALDSSASKSIRLPALFAISSPTTDMVTNS